MHPSVEVHSWYLAVAMGLDELDVFEPVLASVGNRAKTGAPVSRGAGAPSSLCFFEECVAIPATAMQDAKVHKSAGYTFLKRAVFTK